MSKAKTNQENRRIAQETSKIAKLSDYDTYKAPIGDIRQKTLENFEVKK